MHLNLLTSNPSSAVPKMRVALLLEANLRGGLCPLRRLDDACDGGAACGGSVACDGCACACAAAGAAGCDDSAANCAAADGSTADAVCASAAPVAAGAIAGLCNMFGAAAPLANAGLCDVFCVLAAGWAKAAASVCGGCRPCECSRPCTNAHTMLTSCDLKERDSNGAMSQSI